MGNTFRTGKLMNGLYVDDNGNVGINTTTINSVKVQINGSTTYEPMTLGTASGTFSVVAPNGLYGMYVASRASGDTWIQVSRNDSATAYNLLLQTNGGNVLIGSTSNPGQKLYVAGDIRGGRLFSYSGGNSSDPIVAPADDTDTGIFYPSANTFAITTGGAERIRITNSGYIGIGTTAPGAKVTIIRDSPYNTGDQGLRIKANDGDGYNIWLGVSSNGYATIQSYQDNVGGKPLLLNPLNGGNVGINTTNPIYKFQTYNTSSEWGTMLQSYGGTETVNTYISHGGGYGLAIDSTANSDSIYLFKLNGGNGGSGQGAIEHLKVLSNGSLLMGTGGTRSYIRMGRFSNSMNNGGEAWIGRASDRPVGVMTVQLGGSTNTNFEVVDRAWSVVVFSVQGNGNYSFAGSNVSDRRKKENISYISTPQLDTLLKLKPATFNKITGIGVSQNTHTGFIAQDILEDGIPNLVHGDEEQGYGLDYDGILALAVKSIQELKAEIEILKNK